MKEKNVEITELQRFRETQSETIESLEKEVKSQKEMIEGMDEAKDDLKGYYEELISDLEDEKKATESKKVISNDTGFFMMSESKDSDHEKQRCDSTPEKYESRKRPLEKDDESAKDCPVEKRLCVVKEPSQIKSNPSLPSFSSLFLPTSPPLSPFSLPPSLPFLSPCWPIVPFTPNNILARIKALHG